MSQYGVQTRQNVDNMVLRESSPGDHTEHKGFRILQEYL